VVLPVLSPAQQLKAHHLAAQPPPPPPPPTVIPPTPPVWLVNQPCLSLTSKWPDLIPLADAVSPIPIRIRSNLWACRVLYEHYGIEPAGWLDVLR
jgi:hypothetical protein